MNIKLNRRNFLKSSALFGGAIATSAMTFGNTKTLSW